MEVFEREMLGMQLDRSNPTINTYLPDVDFGYPTDERRISRAMLVSRCFKRY